MAGLIELIREPESDSRTQRERFAHYIAGFAMVLWTRSGNPRQSLYTRDAFSSNRARSDSVAVVKPLYGANSTNWSGRVRDGGTEAPPRASRCWHGRKFRARKHAPRSGYLLLDRCQSRNSENRRKVDSLSVETKNARKTQVNAITLKGFVLHRYIYTLRIHAPF